MRTKHGLIALALLLCACGGGGNTPPPSTGYQPPLSGWTQVFGTAAVDAIGSFDFPHAPGSSQYVVHPAITVQLGQTVTLVFSISGSGTWGINDPTDTLPPHVHLFLWEKGDPLCQIGQETNCPYETYREWCGSVDISTPGQYTLSCKLDPTLWTGVFGKTPSADAFQQLLNNLYGLGFTFGGASFAGHGVYSAMGSFHFALIDYTVQ